MEGVVDCRAYMQAPPTKSEPDLDAKPGPKAAPGILIDRELRRSLGSWIRPGEGAAPISPAQIQPASLDLRLGRIAYRIRAGFLPDEHPGSSPGQRMEERLVELSTSTVSLEGDGAVLERGLIYLIQLEEELELPTDCRARFNPRSSTGRCDLFTRVLVPGHPRFDETPRAYAGKLWIEVAPLSFPVRLRRGDRLCQLRLQRGRAGLTGDELRAIHRDTPLCYSNERPLREDELHFDDDGAIALRVGLESRSPCGWRAALHTDVLRFAETCVHAREDFWEPITARRNGCVLDPGRFYIFASRERICIPPELAAEMLPIDVGIGELRNNYAGFFDSGFGWSDDGLTRGTPAVLEVRAHDVPFLIEDGQVFFRLRYFRTTERPQQLYGEGRSGPSYGTQDLTLARPFHTREP